MSSPATKPSTSRTSSGGAVKASWSEKAAALGKAAKSSLGEARNLKSEIKLAAYNTIDKLVALVKEMEAVHKHEKGSPQPSPIIMERYDAMINSNLKITSQVGKTIEEFARILNEDKELVEEVKSNQDRYKQELDDQLARVEETTVSMLQEVRECSKLCGDKLIEIERTMGARCESAPTYAQVLVQSPAKPPSQQLHSLIVTPTDSQNTSAQTIDQIKNTVNAKHSGVRVERVRKIRDGRVVLSCASREELQKVGALLEAEKQLKVEHATNKRPLVVLKNLLAHNTDADIETALLRQNEDLMEALSADEAKVEVRYRRRARNPMECHAVLRVSPKLWQRLTSAGRVYIDLQSIKVQDQSPLVQCTRCLGFGHGRKLCTEDVDLCNYCGGPHLKSECTQLLEGREPSCKNCAKAKLATSNHTAYSDDCPVRKKWDALARSAVAYS